MTNYVKKHHILRTAAEGDGWFCTTAALHSAFFRACKAGLTESTKPEPTVPCPNPFSTQWSFSLSLSLSACLPAVCLCLCLFLCFVCPCLSVCLPACRSVCLPVGNQLLDKVFHLTHAATDDFFQQLAVVISVQTITAQKKLKHPSQASFVGSLIQSQPGLNTCVQPTLLPAPNDAHSWTWVGNYASSVQIAVNRGFGEITGKPANVQLRIFESQIRIRGAGRRSIVICSKQGWCAGSLCLQSRTAACQ